MKKTPSVTIVVPFFNQENVVGNCIRNLLNQDYPSDRLNFVFIDDGSSDETARILKEFALKPQIKSIFFSENRGRSAARNAGIAAADSELIGFLDGDMTVESDWLQLLIDILDSNVVGAMGDSRLPEDTTPNRLDRYFYSFYRGARRIGENQPLHFRWFLFNNAVIRRSVLDEIGNFDQTFTTYGGEDTDLAIRLWQAYPAGLRFSTRAVSYHHHRRTVKTFCATMECFGFENLPRLLDRYPEYSSELAGTWVWSLKGRLVFNCIVRTIIQLFFRVLPWPLFVRYLVIDSVIRGARRAGKDS